MKKEFFKKRIGEREIFPNFILNGYELISTPFSDGKMKILGPLLLATVTVSFIIVDRSLGIFLGITNSINFLAQAAGETSKGGGSLSICKTIANAISKVCALIGKMCQQLFGSL